MYPVGWTIWKSLETSLGSCSRLAGTGPECQLSGKGQSYPQTMALWIAGVVTQKQIRKKERPSVMLGDSSGNPIKYGTPLAVFKDKYESIAIRH